MNDKGALWLFSMQSFFLMENRQLIKCHLKITNSECVICALCWWLILVEGDCFQKYVKNQMLILVKY